MKPILLILLAVLFIAAYRGANNTTLWYHVDKTSSALSIVDYAHQEIHTGNHYNVDGFTSIAANDSISFGFFTRDTTAWKHLLWQLQGTGQTGFYVREGAIFDTTSGSSVTITNNNRNSSKTSTALIRLSPTYSNVGTLISSSSFGTTTNPATNTSGSTTRNNELLLKQNEYYMFLIKNGNSTNVVDYTADFYEHISKNN